MIFVSFVKLEARVRKKFKTHYLRPPDVVVGCVRGPSGAPYLVQERPVDPMDSFQDSKR